MQRAVVFNHLNSFCSFSTPIENQKKMLQSSRSLKIQISKRPTIDFDCEFGIQMKMIICKAS